MAVSVPLRGVGCFQTIGSITPVEALVSVPLRGVGCFYGTSFEAEMANVSVPLRGVGCFAKQAEYRAREVFPSPCGVWVVSLADSINYHIDSVSVPLRGVGCF